MASTENYSNVVQALAKEIVATCTSIIKENNEREVKQLIKTSTISANQISGGITANKLTGNITTSQIQDFDLISANIARAVIDVAEIDVANIQNLETEVARIAAAEIQDAVIDAANIHNLSAEVARIAQAYIDEADIDVARIQNLQAAVADIVEAHIEWASVENLEAYVANIADARIAHAEIGEADVEVLKAYTADIVDAAIQNATIDAAQINNLSAAVSDLLVANIATANIDWADIQSLSAAVADIVNANISEAQISYANITGLDAQVAAIADAQIANATIDVAQVTNLDAEMADIADARIGQATIDAAQITDLSATVADIADAQIANATIGAAQITDLDAEVADITTAAIDSATIRYGQITGLDATQALITRGVGEKLYIKDLAVTEANIVSLQAGEIIVEGDNGQLYRITVDDDGNVVAEVKQIENDNILDGTINAGEKVLAGSITADTLNIADIFANNALIRQLMAQNIDTTTLFARQATIEQLNTMDLSSNSSLRMIVANNNIIKSDTAPTSFETNTMWFNTSTGTLKYWDGDEWADYETMTTRVSGTEPTGFSTGALWINSDGDTPSLWVWDGLMWVRDTTVQVGTTSPSDASVYWLDTSGSTPVVKRYIGGSWHTATATVSATAPVDTRKTIIWINPDENNTMYRWDGNEWYEFNGLNGTVIKQTTTPVGPMVDTLWLDTSGDNDELKRWDGSQWVGSGMAELKIDINSITSRVSDAEGRLSLIEQTAEGLRISVENMEYPQVGGRNLLSDSDHTFTRTKDSDSAEIYRFSLATESTLETMIGSDMVLTYYVYCPGERQSGLLNSDTAGNAFGSCLTLKWGNSDGDEMTVTTALDNYIEKDNLSGRVETTAKITAPDGYDTLLDAYVTMQLIAKPASTNDETWRIGQPFLAFGTTTAGYTPAPEDTEETIAAMRAEFKVLSDSISMFVTKEEYNSAMVDLNTLIGDADTKAVNAQTLAENAKTVADSAADNIAETLRDVIGIDNEDTEGTILYRLNNAQITVSDESIRQAVQSSTAFQNLTEAIGDEETEDSILWRLNNAEQTIQPDNIVNIVTSSTAFGDNLEARMNNYSTIQQTADAITAAVANVSDETNTLASRVSVLEDQIVATVSSETYSADLRDQDSKISAIEMAALAAKDTAEDAITAIGDENTKGSILYRLKDAKLDITDDYIRQTVFNTTTYDTASGTVGAAIKSIEDTSELVDDLKEALDGDGTEENPGVLSRLTAAEQEISGNGIVSRVIASQEFEAYSNQALAAYYAAQDLQDAVNNKNKTYASAVAPTTQTNELVNGDIWIDIDHNNTPYRWNGDEWVSIDNLGDENTEGSVKYRLTVAEQKITDENITLQVQNIYGNTLQEMQDQIDNLDEWAEGAKLTITSDGIYQLVKSSEGYSADQVALQDDIDAAAASAQSALDVLNDTQDGQGNTVKGLISRMTEAESLVTEEAITDKIRSTNVFKNLENAIGDASTQGSIMYRLNEAESKLTDDEIYNAVARTDTFTNTMEILEAAKDDSEAALALANQNSTLIGTDDDEGTLIYRVTQAEQSIQPDSIVQTVRSHSDYIHDLGEKADISSLDAYSTIEQTQDMIQSTVEKIYNTPSGGTNMLSDTKYLIARLADADEAYIYRYSLTDEIVLNDLIGMDVTLSYYLNAPGERAVFAGSKQFGNWFGGLVEVTWSDSTGTLDDTVVNYMTDRLEDIVTARRVRVSGNLTAPEGYDTIEKMYVVFYIFAKPASTNEYSWSIGKPKLEMGLFATDYSVAPEDNDLIVASLRSSIKQTEDSIKLMVTKEEYNQFVGNDFENLRTLAQEAVDNAADAVSATSALSTIVNGTGEDDTTSILYKATQAYSAVIDGTLRDSITSAVIESVNENVDDAVNAVLSGAVIPESIDIQYAKSTSNTTPPLAGSDAWQTTSPEWEEGYYIWQRTVMTYTNSDPEISDPVCISGAKGADGTSVTILGSFDTEGDLIAFVTGKTFNNGDGYLVNGNLYVYDGASWTNVGNISGPQGVGVSSIKEQYYQSTSDTVQAGGDWIDEQPTWTAGTYIWTRSMITYTDGTQSPTNAVVAKTLNDLLARAAALDDELGDESTKGTIRYIVKDYDRIATDEAVYEALTRVTTYQENLRNLEDLRNTVGSDDSASGTLLQRVNAVERLTTADSIVTTVRESSQYANDLALKADRTELNNYSTIEQTKDMIRLSVTSMQSEIIGGANMINKSDSLMMKTRDDDSAFVYRYEPVSSLDLNSLIGNYVTLSYYLYTVGERERGIGGSTINNWFGGLLEVEWADSTGNLANKVVYLASDRMEETGRGNRVKATAAMIAPEGYDTIEKLYITFFLIAKPTSTNTKVWKVGRPKLEMGSFASDYTVASADIDSQMEQLETNFEVKAGEILEEAKKYTSDELSNYAKVSVTPEGVVSISQSTKTVEFDADELATAITNRIESIKTIYAQNTSPSKAPTTGWTETLPQARTGYYIWAQSVYRYPDDLGEYVETYSAPVCLGETISSNVVVGVEDEYCVSNSPNETPKVTDTWVDEYPGLDITKYVWTRTRITYDDGSESTTNPTLVNYDIQRAIQLVDEVANGAIASISIQYNQNTSATTAPGKNDAGWRTTPYEWAEDKYIWQRTVSVSAIGEENISNPVCISGKDGVGIASTSISYQAGNSATIPPTGTWSSSVVNTTAGQYLWTKRVINYTDGTTSNPEYTAVYHATDGSNTHIAYASDANGTNISKTPSNSLGFIGFYKSNGTQSLNPSLYTWSSYKATIKSIVVQYAVTTSSTRPTSGWSTSIKVANAGEYLWTKTTTTYNDGTVHDDYNYSYHAANGNFTHFKFYDEDPNEMTAAELAQITMLETPSEFIGILVDDNPEDSTDPTDYKWTRFTGRAGYTPNVKFAYANGGNPSASGFNWSENYFEGATHLGVLVDVGRNLGTYTASDYTWSSIVGSTPQRFDDQYCILGNGTSPSSSTTWVSTCPTWVKNKSIWTRTKITWTDGNITYTTPVAATVLNQSGSDASDAKTSAANAATSASTASTSAANAATSASNAAKSAAQSIIGVEVQYVLSSSATTAPASTAGWSTTAPQWQSGKYMWQRTVIKYGNKTETSEPTCISGANGQDGNGINLLGTYDSLSALQSAHPTATQGDCYMVDGILYVWSGSTWTNCGNIQGPQGRSISSVATQYYLSTSKTTCTGGSWVSNSEPTWAAGRYLWVRYVYSFDDGSTPVWTAPVLCSTYNKLLSDQAEVFSQMIKEVIIKYVRTDREDIPPTHTANWVTDVTQLGEGKHLWQCPFTTYYDTSIGEYMGNPVCIDAADGASVVNIITEYYLSTSKTKQEGGDWQEEEPVWTDDYEWVDNKIVWNTSQYVWTRSRIILSEGPDKYTEPMLANMYNEAHRENKETKLRFEKSTDEAFVRTMLDTVKNDKGETLLKRFSTVEQTATELSGYFEDENGTGKLKASANGLSAEFEKEGRVGKLETTVGTFQSYFEKDGKFSNIAQDVENIKLTVGNLSRNLVPDSKAISIIDNTSASTSNISVYSASSLVVDNSASSNNLLTSSADAASYSLSDTGADIKTLVGGNTGYSISLTSGLWYPLFEISPNTTYNITIEKIAITSGSANSFSVGYKEYSGITMTIVGQVSVGTNISLTFTSGSASNLYVYLMRGVYNTSTNTIPNQSNVTYTGVCLYSVTNASPDGNLYTDIYNKLLPNTSYTLSIAATIADVNSAAVSSYTLAVVDSGGTRLQTKTLNANGSTSTITITNSSTGYATLRLFCGKESNTYNNIATFNGVYLMPVDTAKNYYYTSLTDSIEANRTYIISVSSVTVNTGSASYVTLMFAGDNKKISLSTGTSTSVSYTAVNAGEVRVYAGQYESTDGVKVTLTGLSIVQAPYYTSQGKFYRELVSGLKAGNYTLSINDISVTSTVNNTTTIDYEFVRDGTSTIAYSGNFTLNSNGTRYVDNAIALNNTKYTYSLLVYAGAKLYTQGNTVLLTEVQLEGRNTEYPTATEWKANSSDAGASLSNGVVNIDGNGVSVSGGSVTINANSEFSVESGGTVKIDADDSESYIRFGGTSADPLFHVSPGGNVRAQSGEFDSIVVGGTPLTRMIQTLASTLVTTQQNNIVYSTTKPSGHGIVWLEPQQGTTNTTTSYGGTVEYTATITDNHPLNSYESSTSFVMTRNGSAVGGETCTYSYYFAIYFYHTGNFVDKLIVNATGKNANGSQQTINLLNMTNRDIFWQLNIGDSLYVDSIYGSYTRVDKANVFLPVEGLANITYGDTITLDITLRKQIKSMACLNNNIQFVLRCEGSAETITTTTGSDLVNVHYIA